MSTEIKLKFSRKFADGTPTNFAEKIISGEKLYTSRGQDWILPAPGTHIILTHEDGTAFATANVRNVFLAFLSTTGLVTLIPVTGETTKKTLSFTEYCRAEGLPYNDRFSEFFACIPQPEKQFGFSVVELCSVKKI